MTNANQEVIYEAAKETAKKIRQALKVSFPGVKFSVRSSIFAGGDSVDVSWTDGPLSNDVDTILGQFTSGHFDGMQDMYVSGCYQYDGKLYNGAKYVMGQRKLSNEYRATIEAYMEENYGDVNINSYEYWGQFNRAEKEMIKTNQPEQVEEVAPVKVESVEVVTVEQDENVTVSMNINEDKNGIELSFTGIPSKTTRELIKENGFKWSAFKKVWYIKKSESALSFTEAFVSAYNEVETVEEVATIEEVEAIEVVNKLNNEIVSLTEIAKSEQILVNESNLIGRKVLGSWGVAGCDFGYITGETIYNEVIIKWNDGHEEYKDIQGIVYANEYTNTNAAVIYLLPIEDENEPETVNELNNEVDSDPYNHEMVETSSPSNKQPAKVLDFTSRFKQRQEEKESQEMQSHFLNDILPYIDNEDKTRLLEAAKDTEKFNGIFQDILIKVSFKQALTDIQKG